MPYPLPVLPPLVTDAALFQEFLEHWHALRGDALLPERRDLSLVEGGAFTHWLTIFEHQPEGDARFWYVGPERSALTTDEMSGAMIAGTLPAHLRAILTAEMKVVFAQPFGRVSRIHGRVDDLETLTETMLLPLRNLSGQPTFAAAVMQMSRWPDRRFSMHDFLGSATRLEILPFDIGAGVPPKTYDSGAVS